MIDVESLERDQGNKYLYKFQDWISLEYSWETSLEYTHLEYTI